MAIYHSTDRLPVGAAPFLLFIEEGRLHKTNALMIAGGSTLDTGDCELLLLALDLLDRFTQDELANAHNNAKQAAMINMRSRLLIVRAKLQAMEIAQ